MWDNETDLFGEVWDNETDLFGEVGRVRMGMWQGNG